ncbi:MAG: class A beta-lactamase-related serine hydrolase [Armatimonadota bacterium]|nr:class A beta-lactamase-related serine hydrolase [Armatimonadota bacterium]
MKHAVLRIAFAGALALSALSAHAEREHTVPTGWWWLQGVSEATVNDKVDEGYRLTDIEVESTLPYTFSAVFVRNSGVHAKIWGWRIAQTELQLENYMNANNLRILDLEVAHEGTSPRLTATMIRNAGADATAWWWYYDRSLAYIDARVREHNARIIDLDTYVLAGTRFYSAVMVRNTGTHYRDWWWFPDATWAQVQFLMGDLNARLVDVEDRGGGRYAVVMQKLNGEYWWWALAHTEADLNHFNNQRGARIIDIETVFVSGQKRFHALMLNNSTPLETRVGKLMRDNTDGVYGFYLKRVGGNVIANIMDTYEFYPASSIKVEQHVYAINRVQGGMSINTPVQQWANSTGDTHFGEPIPPTSPLGDVLEDMMVNSSNSATNHIQDHFGNANGVVGRALINAYGHDIIELSDSMWIHHKFGTGGPDGNNPWNIATLQDFGIIYERVADGTLLNNTNRDLFYSLMLSRPWGTNSGHINDILDLVDEEAALLGVSNANRDLYKTYVQVAHKAGSLNVSLSYASNIGWLRLPIKPSDRFGSRIGFRQYVWGVYVDAFTFNTPPQTPSIELLRDEVRTTLMTFL